MAYPNTDTPRPRNVLGLSNDAIAILGGLLGVMAMLASIVAMLYVSVNRTGAMEANLHDQIALLRSDVQDDIALLRADVKDDIALLRADVKEDIDLLRSEVADIRSDVDGLRSDVDGLRSDVDGLRSDMDGLRSDMTDLRSDMTGLRSEVAENRRIFQDKAVEHEGRIARMETLHDVPTPHSHNNPDLR